ncbi:MAG: hypothetical protein DRQ10_07435, partial [Candidatus Hydrothermota bacterium]
MRLKIGKNWVMGVALMFGLATTLMAGTTGKIAGRVIDADTKEGLPGANVVIEGTKIGTATDLDGYFVILNVPPGTYNVKASMLGYQPVVIKGVRVEADRTTEVNFKLKQTAIVQKEVVVVAKAPVIKKDLTASVNIVKGEDIQTLPIADVSQVVTQQAGVIERGGLHIRGGRAGESVYVVDGVEVRDPYGGATQAAIPLLAMEETEISKGGFDVDQGTASSGAINVITKEGGPRYEAAIYFRTGDFSFLGDKLQAVMDANAGDPYYHLLKDIDAGKVTIRNEDELADYLSDPKGKHKEQPKHFEFAIGGPLLPTQRKGIRFFISGYYDVSKGRFPLSEDPDWNNWEKRFQWKLSVPAANFKFFTSGFVMKTQSKSYSSEWRLALDQLSRFNQDLKQIILGVNYLFGTKAYLELRGGFYDNEFLYNVPEDADEDGVDDFADRDYDGYIEVDYDYFIDMNGDTVDIRALYGDILDVGDGWVELPLHWWDYELIRLYPTVASGPSWWSEDPNDFPNTYNWGHKTRKDLIVVVIDTTTGRLAYGEQGEGNTVITLTGDTLAYQKLLLKLGNQYIADAHTWPRDQWYYGHSKTYTLTGRFMGQVAKAHELLVGFEYKRHKIIRYGADYASGGNFYFTFVNVPFVETKGEKWFETHPTNPYSFAAYIRDKIEIEGMVAKVGVRYDYLNSDGWVPGDPNDPFDFDPATNWGFIKNPVKAKPKWHLSPRIGVSHPISERDVLHFTYGHYYQIPPLSYMIRDYVFSGAFPIMGNPDLKPEKQIAYELGVKHAFTPNIVLGVTAYYKDIKGWSRIKMIYLPSGRNYSTYVNEDYGDVRGIEFDFQKRPGGAMLPFLGISVAYTYQIAKGSFSSPRDAYHWAWSGYPMPDKEHPLDWDQRHNLLINVSVISPKGKPLLGIDDWGFTIQYSYGSGYPYTPPIRTQREAIELINSKRLPSTQNTNLRFYKNFAFGPVAVRTFLDIYNLFNRK